MTPSRLHTAKGAWRGSHGRGDTPVRLLDSVRLVFPRFLSGILGTWSVIGPFILSTGSGFESWGIALLLLLLLLLCHLVVLVICLRGEWEALKELVSETTLAMCFMIVGLLIQELTGIFVAIKHDLAIVYVFIGFFIAELMQPKAPLKALGPPLTSVIRNFWHSLVRL